MKDRSFIILNGEEKEIENVEVGMDIGRPVVRIHFRLDNGKIVVVSLGIVDAINLESRLTVANHHAAISPLQAVSDGDKKD